MKQNKRVAVTGGIGSGKSTLLAIFKQMGYPVISCDEVSATLWQDEAYKNNLAALFPACVIHGKLDKAVLSALVFSDAPSREKLNAFSHPYILQRVLSAMSGELCFAEVPLLFEGGYETLFDAVIAVKRKRETRIAAVRARSGLTQEEVENRMRCQFDENLLQGKNCIIVENDGNLRELQTKAEEIIERLKTERGKFS